MYTFLCFYLNATVTFIFQKILYYLTRPDEHIFSELYLNVEKYEQDLQLAQYAPRNLVDGSIPSNIFSKSKGESFFKLILHVTRIRRIKICLNNLKMAKYYLIFARMLFNIRFEVEYLDLEPSFFCFTYYSTQVTEVCYSL